MPSLLAQDRHLKGLISKYRVLLDPEYGKRGLIKSRNLKEMRVYLDYFSVAKNDFPIAREFRELLNGAICVHSANNQVRFALCGVGSKCPDPVFTQIVWDLLNAIEQRDDTAAKEILGRIHGAGRRFAVFAMILLFWLFVFAGIFAIYAERLAERGVGYFVTLLVLTSIAVPASFLLARFFQKTRKK